jgi:hypothetical protein
LLEGWRGVDITQESNRFYSEPLSDDVSVRVLATNRSDTFKQLSDEFEHIRLLVLNVADPGLLEREERFYKNELSASELDHVKKRLDGLKNKRLSHAYDFIKDGIDRAASSGCQGIFLRASTGQQNASCRTQELHRDKFTIDDDELMSPLLERGVVVSRFLTVGSNEGADSTVILNPAQSIWGVEEMRYIMAPDTQRELFSPPLGDVVRFTPVVYDLYNLPRSGYGQAATFHRSPVEKRGLFLQAV